MTVSSGIRGPWRAIAGIVLATGIALAGQGGAAAPAATAQEGAADACVHSIAHSERAEDIPAHLLAAISLAETGRWDARRQAIVAWPWTVTAGERGFFLDTKEAAIATVGRLRAEGVRNIDVGCMQVNLLFHPAAFPTLEAAFDPARNVAYAARFLKTLRNAKRSWSQAVAHYHSATRDHSEPYRKKVFKLWNEARRRAAEAHRRAVIKAYRERQAAREAQRAARQRTKTPPEPPPKAGATAPAGLPARSGTGGARAGLRRRARPRNRPGARFSLRNAEAHSVQSPRPRRWPARACAPGCGEVRIPPERGPVIAGMSARRRGPVAARRDCRPWPVGGGWRQDLRSLSQAPYRS